MVHFKVWLLILAVCTMRCLGTSEELDEDDEDDQETCGLEHIQPCLTEHVDAIKKTKDHCHSTKVFYKCFKKLLATDCVPDEKLKDRLFLLLCEWQMNTLLGSCDLGLTQAFKAKTLQFRTPVIESALETGFIDLAFAEKKPVTSPMEKKAIWNCYQVFANPKEIGEDHEYCNTVEEWETCVESSHDKKNPFLRSVNAITHIIADFYREQYKNSGGGECKVKENVQKKTEL